MKNKATIKDIAKYADVSIATVSRYINQSRQLNPDTAQRIKAAIEHFNYIPNDNARALRSKNERIIGIIFPDISNAFFANIFKAIEELLFEQKIFVLLCNSNEDGEKEKEYLYRLLQKRVDAIVIAPTGANHELLKEISRTTPVIIFDRKQEEIAADQLYANDYTACSQLTEHILSCGHHRIAYVLGAANSSTSRYRYEGFQQTMAKHHLTSEHYYLITTQDEAACRQEFHYLLMQNQISAALIPSPKKLNWFLMERNQLFLKGYRSALSFAGFATPAEFDISEIPLTGVLQREAIYAAKLAKMIIDRLNKPNSKIKEIELKLSFRKGNSIGKYGI